MWGGKDCVAGGTIRLWLAGEEIGGQESVRCLWPIMGRMRMIYYLLHVQSGSFMIWNRCRYHFVFPCLDTIAVKFGIVCYINFRLSSTERNNVLVPTPFLVLTHLSCLSSSDKSFI